MKKTLSLLLCAPLLITVGLLVACGGDAVPILTASSALVDFGEVAVGETTSATLRVANVGSAEAEVSLPTISGDDAAAFAVVDSEWPMSVAAGATAEISLSFSPTDSGVRSAELELSGVLPGALSGGAGSASAANASLAVALLGVGGGAGDDDDSGGDDDTSGDDDTVGDDDDTAGDDDDTGGSVDGDGDGYRAQAGGGDDCDDADAAVHPGAPELCDGIDNDCSGQVDDAALDADTWYLDADNDGYGSSHLSLDSCAAPPGYANNSNDCDDLDPTSYPGGTEVCDGADNDCNNSVDEGVQLTLYQDSDSDGYGSGSGTADGCNAAPGYVDNDADCDDADATINPSAYELCDSIDNDCDSSVDEDSAVDAATWYADSDGDGYGDPAVSAVSCSAPSGYGADDTDGAIHRAASEL